MSNGLLIAVGALSSIVVMLIVVAVIALTRQRQEKRFAQALLIAEAWEQEESEPTGRDLLSMTSALSYGLLLRQAVHERCEEIEDDDVRLSLVDDLIEIAEAYGNGLVKRSKSSRY